MKVIMRLYIVSPLQAPSPLYLLSSVLSVFAKKSKKPTSLFPSSPFASPNLPRHRDLCRPTFLIKQAAPPTHPLPPPPSSIGAGASSASRLHQPTCLPHPPAGLLLFFTFGHLSPPSSQQPLAMLSPPPPPPPTPTLTLSVAALFADPGGVQGPDGAPAEHAWSSQCHAEVQGDYTAGDPSGQCEPSSLMCAFVCVCVL